MTQLEYQDLCKKMSSEAAIKSSHSRRNGYEQQYYFYHRSRGVRLRGKYRPQ